MVHLIVAEDSQAVIAIVQKGRTPAHRHRHLHRTHRINLDWITETWQHNQTNLNITTDNAVGEAASSVAPPQALLRPRPRRGLPSCSCGSHPQAYA
eukprot:2489720-Pyramimonas_sp.AAC.1